MCGCYLHNSRLGAFTAGLIVIHDPVMGDGMGDVGEAALSRVIGASCRASVWDTEAGTLVKGMIAGCFCNPRVPQRGETLGDLPQRGVRGTESSLLSRSVVLLNR